MATPQEKLASALGALKALQDRGVVAIRAADLERTHRELLLEHGFLREVMKGWYIATRPNEPAGESTSWFASFWAFCAAYLSQRFDDVWTLSPEQSVSLHAGNWTVPKQLQVRSPKGGNKVTPLPFDTSLFELRAKVPEGEDIQEINGIRAYSRPAALIASTTGIFAHSPTDTRTVLASIRDASELLGKLLEGGHSTVAGRLAGAFRNVGREKISSDIVETMRTAGYTVREHDPFAERLAVALPQRERSPYAARIRILWESMRGTVVARFPPSHGPVESVDSYLEKVREVYVTDAYHSLSLEGYQVSPDLIDRIRSGQWDPEAHEGDRPHRDALAARGYWLAYQAVQQSLRSVLQGENPGVVADNHHATWYRELFAPSVTAGLLRPADLAGYRSGPVYIRRSMHVPPSPEAVRDAMPALFEMLKEEMAPAVRVVLGHFFFGYIHPYPDGNGRIGRFLMNVMLAAGGYPWTVVPVEKRSAYMAALEDASVRQDIAPFTDFLATLINESPMGSPA